MAVGSIVGRRIGVHGRLCHRPFVLPYLDDFESKSYDNCPGLVRDCNYYNGYLVARLCIKRTDQVRAMNRYTLPDPQLEWFVYVPATPTHFFAKLLNCNACNQLNRTE